MGITKKQSDFRGRERCTKARIYDTKFNFVSEKGDAYNNAIVIKDIITGVLSGTFDKSEISDLVDQGFEGEYLTAETGRRKKARLVSLISRYINSERRKPMFLPAKQISVKGYDVSVKPDVVFDSGTCIDLVVFRTGKPDVKQRGRAKDVGVNTCIELYFLNLYGRELLKPGDNKEIRSSYYYLRKDTDASDSISDMDFFSGQGGNVVYLSEMRSYDKKDEVTSLDTSFLEQIDEYSVGEECSGDTCKYCKWNGACHYVQVSEKQEKVIKKAGKIVFSPEQQQVIDFQSGYARVNASAGSGKTECVTERVMRLISDGVKPEEILLITFTDAGAAEMKKRILSKAAARDILLSESSVKVTTFNGFANEIVLDNWRELGFVKQPRVIDEVANNGIIAKILDDNQIPGLDYLNFRMDTGSVRGALSVARKAFDIIKAKAIDPESPDAQDDLMDELRQNGYSKNATYGTCASLLDAYDTYKNELIEDCLITFSDQEPLMYKVLSDHPDYFNGYGFKHIIVDEFQDTNDVQLETIRLLCSTPSFVSLVVVGDDSQSIFSFRNTSPENIINFFDKMGVKGTDIYLTANRRSLPPIIALANKVNDLNENKVDKEMVATRDGGKEPIVQEYFSVNEEYDAIIAEMKKLYEQGTPYEDMVFESFTNAELTKMAAKLTEANIPWVMKNPLPLCENSAVKAALSLAEAFWQPEATQIYFDYLNSVYEGKIFDMDPEQIDAKVEQMKQLYLSMEEKPLEEQRAIFHEQLNALISEKGDEIYEYFLSLIFDNEDLPSELEYIRAFKLYGENVRKKMEGNYNGVTLVTGHSAKGLEWPVVFLSVDKFDNMIFHNRQHSMQNEIEERRRLLFVAITRARDLLYVTGNYTIGGNAKDGYEFNNFLIELYGLVGKEFLAYDPEAAKKAQEKKDRAKASQSGSRFNKKINIPGQMSFKI